MICLLKIGDNVIVVLEVNIQDHQCGYLNVMKNKIVFDHVFDITLRSSIHTDGLGYLPLTPLSRCHRFSMNIASQQWKGLQKS